MSWARFPDPCDGLGGDDQFSPMNWKRKQWGMTGAGTIWGKGRGGMGWGGLEQGEVIAARTICVL